MTISFEAQVGYSVACSPSGTGHEAVSRRAKFYGTGESVGWGGASYGEPQSEPIEVNVYKMDSDPSGISTDIVESFLVIGKPEGHGGIVNGLELKPGSVMVSTGTGTVITSI